MFRASVGQWCWKSTKKSCQSLGRYQLNWPHRGTRRRAVSVASSSLSVSVASSVMVMFLMEVVRLLLIVLEPRKLEPRKYLKK